MAMDVVVATRNPGKARELTTLLAPLGWTLHMVSEFTGEVANESASSYVENALIKARHAAGASGLPALADDSGLEVAALSGEPGVRSARYAGYGASDTDNNRRLLVAMKHVDNGLREARYVCAMVLLRRADDATPLIAHGVWRGRILRSPRGQGGFGYDPLFYLEDVARTAAELKPDVKNQLSHRSQAARHLLSLIRNAHD